MARNRDIALIVSWAAFIWGILNLAVDASVSDNYLVNLAYTIAWMAAGIIIVLATLAMIGRVFQPRLVVAIAVATLLIIALAGAEHFWLRPWVAQWF